MMKRRYLVFLVFFIFLYIGPVNLLPHDVPFTIVEQPQIQQEKQHSTSTDYDVEIAADADDSRWWLDAETSDWTHTTTSNDIWVRNRTDTSPDYIYFAGQRFQLNIVKDATISSATLTLYESVDTDATDSQIYRIDETNVGPMEDDTVHPIRNNDTSPSVYNWEGDGAGWETVTVTDLIQAQVDLAGWVSGYYIGFWHCADTTKTSEGQWSDYQQGSNYAYLNITYSTETANNVPYTSVIPACSNLDDTDNLYAQLREYDLAVNVTDEDGFADLDYVELSLWSNARTTEYWRIRFDEDTATFSEQSDPSNMITLGSGANVSSGDNLNITFSITIHWNHTDTINTDMKVYVCDDEAQVEYFADDAKFGLFGTSFSANYPATYYYNGFTYVGWHGANDAEDDAGDPWIRAYDHSTGFWSDAYKVAVNPLDDDSHGSPAMWVNTSGYIHVTYGAHSSHLLQHAVSNEPESVSDGFTVLDAVDTTDLTYPKISYDDVTGVVHMVYRWVDQLGDHDYFWRYVNSTDSGYTWSDEYTWLQIDDGGGQADGAYPYLLGPAGLDPYSRDRIHMAFAVWNETKGLAGDDNMYYCYLNLTDYHVYNAAGVDFGTIDDEAELNDNFMVFDSENYSTAVSSVKVDSSHTPYILFASEYDDSSGHNFFTYWNGSGWETPEVVCDVNRYSAGGDMIIYASDNITAFLTDGEDMTRWSWDGESWTKEETIRTATASRDLANALVTAPYGETPEDEFIMIYGEFFDDYACKGYAWNYDGNVNVTSADLGWYEVNYDVETRLDLSSFSLNDGSGTPDRGDYDTLDGITASGTIVYYGSAFYPDSAEVDVWISCSDVEGGPWSDTTLTAGVFSVTVDSDNEVGLDTYSFIVVEKGAGVGGPNLCHASHSDTYIADRLIIDIQADENTPFNEQQVNFTLTITYDYDDTVCSTYQIVISRTAVWWHSFTNANKTLFNDTNSDVWYVYTTFDISETTHGLTKYSSNSESVTWSGEATPTTTTFPTTTTIINYLEGFFLGTGIGGLIGPFALLIVGFSLMTNKKYKPLGGLWIVLELIVISQYFTLLESDVGYWWHIILMSLGVVVSIFQSLR